jgi:hypothetical protein
MSLSLLTIDRRYVTVSTACRVISPAGRFVCTLKNQQEFADREFMEWGEIEDQQCTPKQRQPIYCAFKVSHEQLIEFIRLLTVEDASLLIQIINRNNKRKRLAQGIEKPISVRKWESVD